MPSCKLDSFVCAFSKRAGKITANEVSREIERYGYFSHTAWKDQGQCCLLAILSVRNITDQLEHLAIYTDLDGEVALNRADGWTDTSDPSDYGKYETELSYLGRGRVCDFEHPARETIRFELIQKTGFVLVQMKQHNGSSLHQTIRRLLGRYLGTLQQL